jgi:predicted RNase H-like HicB family nuclease
MGSDTPTERGLYGLTSLALPEFITEGDTLDAALAHVQGALHGVIKLDEDLRRPLPEVPRGGQQPDDATISFEYTVAIP